MSHPHTSDVIGFRRFDADSGLFGSLQETGWDFDGSVPDVREFAEQTIGAVESIKETTTVGTYDVRLSDGTEYRIYTR